MKITCLIENTSACGMPTEHGLSLFVECDSACFLFDMGQSPLFAENARALGIDLNRADFAVLSHGHYDHGGGMTTFFAENDHAPVYVSRYAFEPHYNAEGKYIGLDPDLQTSDRIVCVDGDLAIRDGIALRGGTFPKMMNPGTSGHRVLRDGAMVDEDYRHEQYLLVEEGGRRILFSGCSHRGILGIVRWFRPDVLVGGFHLFRHPVDDKLAEIADALNELPTAYYTCHCTGVEQYQFMKTRMGNARYISAGEVLTL